LAQIRPIHPPIRQHKRTSQSRENETEKNVADQKFSTQKNAIKFFNANQEDSDQKVLELNFTLFQ
jgi:hypothetical protein